MKSPLPVVLLAVTLLAGCALVPSDPNVPGEGVPVTMTIEEAKAEVVAEYDRVLAILPGGSQVSKRVDTATLVRCDNGGFWWPGGLYVSLPADVEPAAVIDAIRAEYSGDPLWQVKEDIPSPSDFAIGLWKGDSGTAYGDNEAVSVSVAVLELSGGGSELSFQPGSRCIMMGSDFDPFTEF